jgi:hypothetical protein
MKAEKYLMNPVTGSVDTEENWLAEKESWKNAEEEMSSLVEVEKDDNGDWVEVIK